MDTIIVRYTKKFDPDTVINTLIQWLKDNGILSQLIEASTHYSTISGLISFMKRHTYGRDLINRSMTWAATPQGSEFWCGWNDAYDEFWRGVFEKYGPLMKKNGLY